eukprot:TRINITY_DN36943_c0_g1_i1.p1 TRINITY_DN36943_c0_g1~~TRINITY_DN36943_c0_g1_i1.p1  ORF type:complete len:1018 (-),score=216.81 TRINITY_DN36943_c0_g1_i1:278-3331(-)
MAMSVVPVNSGGVRSVPEDSDQPSWLHAGSKVFLSDNDFYANPKSKEISGSRRNLDESLKHRGGRLDMLRHRSRLLCDSWRFCVLTTSLTIYALFGDDFRLTAMHKRTDVFFNILTIFCMLVFSIEILAASLGKDHYFMGFFFALDIGSTITLMFDLTWIGELMFCNNNMSDDDDGTLRSSRAGRAGARASRTVRLIRLIRLVKLYKTYKIAVEKKTETSVEEAAAPGGAEHDGDEDLLRKEDLEEEEEENGEAWNAKESHKDNSEAKGNSAETRVGKKLSEMTTRRVILLVLVMLFIMPQLSPDDTFQSSAAIGLEMIYERYRDWCHLEVAANSSAMPWCLNEILTKPPAVTPSASQMESRWWLENYVLKYIYNHHEVVMPGSWRLYWVGIDSNIVRDNLSARAAASDDDTAEDGIGRLGQLGSSALLGDAFAERLAPSRWASMFRPDPTEPDLAESVKKRLAEPWRERCSGFYGVTVAPDLELEGEPASFCSINEEMRCSEWEDFFPQTITDHEMDAVYLRFAFDKRSETTLESSLSMVQTIFICCAVGIGAMTFSNNANQLLLKPIERMVAKMEAIKDNPLEAMKLGDLEFRREEIEAAKQREQLAKSGRIMGLLKQWQQKKIKEPMETVILEKTIIKLGGLLALGFGEAGAEIIGQNMKGSASASVNAMVPGSKVDAIIGFCNIRNFGDATEVLKEKVMLFVNQVGEIVHGCVDDYHGAPNKNIGDAFLLVWRLASMPPEKQTKLADMAMMSFVRILTAIQKSPVLAEYRGHPGLLQRLPDYRVEMGFGLHCGWAIEGAIGSKFKIDASYLSPNVNVSSRLEAATTQFGVWILISHFMINLCSQEMADKCRLIDHVTVKGSKQPVRLYTLDLDYWKIPVQHRPTHRVVKNRFKVRQIREVRKEEKWADDYNVWEAFSTDDDLISMRSTYKEDFIQRFSMAYRNYEAGEWMVARDMLYTCQYDPDPDIGGKQVAATKPEDWPPDGPTRTLLRFMQQTNFWPPMDWPGHRELMEK